MVSVIEITIWLVSAYGIYSRVIEKRFYLFLFNCMFNVITHRKSNLKNNFILTKQQNNLRISDRRKYEINKYFKNTFIKAIYKFIKTFKTHVHCPLKV